MKKIDHICYYFMLFCICFAIVLLIVQVEVAHFFNELNLDYLIMIGDVGSILFVISVCYLLVRGLLLILSDWDSNSFVTNSIYVLFILVGNILAAIFFYKKRYSSQNNCSG